MSDQAIRLPEVQWLYRRLFAFSGLFLAAGLLAFVIHKLDDPEALKNLGLAACSLIALMALLYLAGATVTDLARLKSARLINFPSATPEPTQ